jgi:hypothetical protein
MADLKVRNLDSPDETRKFAAHGYAELVMLGDLVVNRGTFEPGWRWSQDVKPIMQTERCPVHHKGLVISGRMHIEYDDGTAGDLRPGDVIDIPPGHDAWVLGEEPCVTVDVSSEAMKYAAPPK